MNAQTARELMVKHDGVVLRYADPGARRAFHVDQRPQREDRERQALIHAERALRRLATIVEHLEGIVSLTGIERMVDALSDIRESLERTRAALGMHTSAQTQPTSA